MAECSGMVTDASPQTRQIKDIIDSLTDLGYEGPLLQEENLQECLTSGLESEQFIHFVTWLSNDITKLLKLEESISTGLGPDDARVFKVELKGLLSSLQCPYRFLINDLEVLTKLDNRFALIEFLTSELQATKLIALDQIEENSKKMEHSAIVLACDATISVLRGLHCSQPPAHVTFDMISSKILTKVQPIVDGKPSYFGTPLLNRFLNREQWSYIERLNTKLEEEFKTRRQLLLTRLEVTLQAFTWKKEKSEHTEKIIQKEFNKGIHTSCSIPLHQLLAARTDLAYQSKTSNTSVLKNTHSSVHKYRMGKVPDRGGRAWETRPPPEMPSFQPRVELPKTDNRGGRQGFQKPQSQTWDRPFNNPPTAFQYQERQQTNRQFSYEPPRGQHQVKLTDSSYYKDNPSFQSSVSFDNSQPSTYKRDLGGNYYEARESQGDQRKPRGGGGYQRRGRGSHGGQGGMIYRDSY